MGLVSTHTVHSRSSVQYESSSTAEEEMYKEEEEEEGHFFGHWAAATPPLAGRLWPNPGLWFPFAWLLVPPTTSISMHTHSCPAETLTND